MASKAMGSVRVGGNVFHVRVEHLDTDSFSRSVDRAAMKYARRILAGEAGWACTGADYAHTVTGRQCISTVTFTR